MSTSTTPSTSRTDANAESTLTVLIADKFGESGVEAARRLGCRVELEPALTADDLPEAVRRHDPDVLIVRSTRVTAEVFEHANALSLVIRAGAGYDTIDVAAASRGGIFVANCPGKNALAVAELTWALILACDRRVPDQTADLRAGRWNKSEYGKARGLYGRTLGVIGLGRIGRAVVERGKAFGMRAIAWSRSLTEEEAEALGIEACASPLDVARRADVVTLHVASTPETRHLVDDAFCGELKKGAILVNTTRGAVVDETALARAVREKGVRAGLDVFAEEPASGTGEFTDAIAGEAGVYGTHHVGASTDQAQDAIATEAVRILQSFATTGTVPNCVNRAAASPATCLLTVRHLNRPGVLAHVFRVIGRAGINVEEMENVIYEGAEAACARIRLDDRPAAAQVAEIRENEHVLSAGVTSVR